MSTPLLMVDPRGSAETSREKTEIHPRRVTPCPCFFFQKNVLKGVYPVSFCDLCYSKNERDKAIAACVSVYRRVQMSFRVTSMIFHKLMPNCLTNRTKNIFLFASSRPVAAEYYYHKLSRTTKAIPRCLGHNF